MTLAIAGEGRNAWRDLCIRLPGARHFRRASLLRQETYPSGRYQPPSRPAALSGAALALADAFVHALAQATPPAPAASPVPAPPSGDERRVARLRRKFDILPDSCDFD